MISIPSFLSLLCFSRALCIPVAKCLGSLEEFQVFMICTCFKHVGMTGNGSKLGNLELCMDAVRCRCILTGFKHPAALLLCRGSR